MQRGGSFTANTFWNEPKNKGDLLPWGKVDAIAIVVARLYIIMFIISIVVSIISLIFIGKAAKKVEGYKYKR